MFYGPNVGKFDHSVQHEFFEVTLMECTSPNTISKSPVKQILTPGASLAPGASFMSCERDVTLNP